MRALTDGVLGILLAGLALGACGGSTAGSSRGPARSPASTPPPSATPAATGALSRESIAVGDDERITNLIVPALPAGVRAPLLVLLHANGSSPDAMSWATRAGELAAREGVIVALPPALGARWHVMVGAVDPITPSADVAYVVGMIDRLAATYPIDRGRVFVAGFSMGAVASERIACEFAGSVAAVALNAGAAWSTSCSPARPVSILVMHGTADRTFTIDLAEDVVRRWRTLDGCSGDPVVAQLSEIARSELNTDCAAGATVQYVRYEGGGHRWLADPDATEVAWSFFASVGSPSASPGPTP